ncbi:hypothetical protein COY23_00210, partial [bacterium (Candidatus Torokbacteria) CG_4_10_14_0_2_um_filter_35_8]
STTTEMIEYVNNIEKIFSIKKHVLLASSYRHYLLSLSDIQKKGELKMMDNRGNDISYSYVLSRDRYKKIYNEKFNNKKVIKKIIEVYKHEK